MRRVSSRVAGTQKPGTTGLLRFIVECVSFQESVGSKPDRLLADGGAVGERRMLVEHLHPLHDRRVREVPMARDAIEILDTEHEHEEREIEYVDEERPHVEWRQRESLVRLPAAS